ncbi:MAG: SUMF1/EgtB/PvdO family nonheme iron enzyme [Rhodomicrobium sp.]
MLALANHAALAEKRVALVIGVNKYENLTDHAQLKRAVNDARTVAQAFGELGFIVTKLEDAGRAKFNTEWQLFLDRIGSGDVVAFYFAGHGVEIEGLNFLIPGDIPLIQYGRQEQIKRESIAVAELLLDLHKRKPGVAILILDACREHPLIPEGYRAASAVPGGLARVDAPEGTFIMYSAGAGQTALDHLPENDPDPVNSIYTRKLLPLMHKKGLKLQDLAVEVRNQVHTLAAAVPHSQTPAYYDGVLGTFCLAGCDAEEQQLAEGKTGRSGPAKSDAGRIWDEVKGSEDVSLIETFREQYGKQNPLYDKLASQRIAVLTGKPPAEVGDVSSWWPWSSTPKPEPAKPKERQTAVVVAKPAPALMAETFKDCPECPEMMVVPPGKFMMGSPLSELEGDENEKPQHTVTFVSARAVSQSAITFTEWEACLADGGCGGYHPDDGGWTTGDRPTINLSWRDAALYIDWLKKKSGKRYRLMTEAEYEYIARAGTVTPFWWGETITPDNANYAGTAQIYKGGGKKGEYRGKTLPVKSLQPNPWGFFQVHGNVYTWVEDCWHATYAGAPSDGSAWLDRERGDCRFHVMRGGAWFDMPSHLRSAYRIRSDSEKRILFGGVRVTRELN